MREPTIPPCGCGSPGRAGAAVCYCSVENLLQVIRRRYALAVMNAIRTHEPARYHEIASALPGASSSTLVETLEALQTARLIAREVPSPDRPLPIYRLTQSGLKLLTRLQPLLEDVAR
jgi:DNA-binding HxlR family transcriptional regulator